MDRPILKRSPLTVFANSRTPAGLYARQKWLGASGSRSWHTDFDVTVAAIMADQLPDGSWSGSVDETARRLFGLHLTVRETCPAVDNGLDWLLDRMAREDYGRLSPAGACPGSGAVKGMPFVVSAGPTYLAGATLFLATVFGRGDQRLVRKQYEMCCRLLIRLPQPWMDAASAHNLFRALVVHPDFSDYDATRFYAQHLAEKQSSAGHWGELFSFYQTFNALAHMRAEIVDEQLEKALPMLIHAQNSDGSWGGQEPEWNTFLAVHALKSRDWL